MAAGVAYPAAATAAVPADSATEVSFLGDAKSSLGDAKSSLGDAKSSLGDARRRARGSDGGRWTVGWSMVPLPATASS